MKKLLTFFAFLMCVLGANAKWSEQPVYTIDYSTYGGFPFYVIGFVPEFGNGCMTDFGAQYGYKTDSEMEEFTGGTEVGTVTNAGGTVYHKVLLDAPSWHQYFIADGIPTQMDGHYKVVAKVKASEAANINVNMGWGWGSGEQLGGTANIPQSDEFVEVEWEYDGVAGTSCNLVAQPGGFTGTIEWESIAVYEYVGGSHPVVWQQWLTNDGKPIIDGSATGSKYVGDAEFGAWPAWATEAAGGINATWRGENSNKICAYSLTMGANFDDQCPAEISADSYRARPYPTAIEAEEGNESNHVFAVHVTQIDQIGDDAASIAWSNQFWVMAPTAFKSGLSVRIKFRYKAEHACSAGTLWHSKYPSCYLYWQAMGDINFTETWQDFDKTVTIPSEANNASSLAFNLCSDETNGRTPNVFYFDDLSWESMKLDEGYFISGINTNIATKYEDLDNAIEFEDGEDTEGSPCLVATVGKQGDEDSYVNQVMISTTRGDNGAFMGSTLKPAGQIKNDPTVWLEYSPSNLAKLNLPGLGVWKVYLDTEYQAMAFELLEGTLYEESDPVDVVTNRTEITVHGQEREYTEYEAEELGIERPDNPGQTWHNEFWIVANRVLEAGEETVVEFDYVANKNASTLTQTHGAPGAYVHWAAIGDVNFDTEWQHFEREFTIPAEAADRDAQSIAFCMAVIKEACNYTITNVRWYVKSDMEGMTYENLIDAEGTKNFYVKEGAGTSPRVYDPSGEIVTPTVWTIAGSSEIFGSYWDPSDTRNDMTQIEEGFYVLEKKNVSLKEGGLYEFKVVANHSWDINYGADGERNGYNVQFTVGESGTYNLYFYFYENENHQLGYGLEFVKGEGQMPMGDVDSNGEINVTDAVLIIDDILGRNPWNFNAEAADVNYDSYINVTDVVLVIDHVLGKVNLNRAAATDAEMGAISLSSDMKTVSLTNPSAYTAFQMDVTLPKGVSLEDVLLTERAARSHSVVIREMENGSYRIVGVSMKNDAFKGNVGDLLQLQLTGNAQGSVAIDNVLFVTPQGVQHELAGVNAFGDVTGISDALRLNDNGQLINDNVFDLQGRQVNNAQLKKGLYILNGKKQVVK